MSWIKAEEMLGFRILLFQRFSWHNRKHVGVCVLLWLCFVSPIEGDHGQQLDVIVDNMTFCTATLDYYYIDPDTQELKKESGIMARYGASSMCHSEEGVAVHIEDEHGQNHGCTVHTGNYPTRKWIGVVQRGNCQFDQKIYHTTKATNASAIVVYNNQDEADIPIMYHMVSATVAVFIHKSAGDTLASLLDRGVDVHLNIRVKNVTTTVIKGNGQGGHSSEGHQGGLGHGLGDAATKSGMLLYISLTLVLLLILGLGGLLVYGLYRARTRQMRRQNTRVVYSENGEVRGFLVEQQLPRPDIMPPPHRTLAPRNVYTTILEEDEEDAA